MTLLNRPRLKPTEDRIAVQKTVLSEREVKLTFTNKISGKQVEMVCDPEQPGYVSKARREATKDLWRD